MAVVLTSVAASIARYMGVHTPRFVTRSLRASDVDVITARADGTGFIQRVASLYQPQEFANRVEYLPY